MAKIVAALHVPERERLSLPLDVYAESFRILRGAGFDVVSLYVLYPPLLSRLRQDMDTLADLVSRDSGCVTSRCCRPAS